MPIARGSKPNKLVTEVPPTKPDEFPPSLSIPNFKTTKAVKDFEFDQKVTLTIKGRVKRMAESDFGNNMTIEVDSIESK